MSDHIRIEYVVFVPDARRAEGRREITRYPEWQDNEHGAESARQHVAHLVRLASDGLLSVRARYAEAFAVEQVIRTSETPLGERPNE